MDRIDILQTIDSDKNAPTLDIDPNSIFANNLHHVVHTLQLEQSPDNLTSAVSFHSLSIINIEDSDDVSFVAYNQQRPRHISSWIRTTLSTFTLLSLLIHVLILFAVGYAGMKIVMHDSSPEATSPIEAKLVYIPLNKPLTEKVEPDTVEPNEVLLEETVRPETLAEANEQEVETPAQVQNIDVDVQEPPVDDQVASEAIELSEEPATASAGNSTHDESLQRYSVSESFSKRLEDLNRVAVQNMNKEALKTRDFDLYGIKNKPNYFEVKEPDSPIKPKNVNCDSGMSRTMVSMSGLFGGSLRCTKKPDINGFIDKRLNKNPKK